jgi:hypothetical protein
VLLRKAAGEHEVEPWRGAAVRAARTVRRSGSGAVVMRTGSGTVEGVGIPNGLKLTHGPVHDRSTHELGQDGADQEDRNQTKHTRTARPCARSHATFLPPGSRCWGLL